MADLLDPLTALADDGAGQLRGGGEADGLGQSGFEGGGGGVGFEGESRRLTSLGIVTCVVMTGPPMSPYEPLLPAEQRGRGVGGVGLNQRVSNCPVPEE